ncbi:MAG: tRNA (5-methylaminomethyl-2-thiouridylate)-methyltransferase, tRNA-specific 2-thiouridylase [Parcubacteria group bacterium]|nr:tRNA (5-methylaminomethyl-2-thiouridylate)-methyltransferase, tRNA-specific 2-thiouridylase [Parcubacteria group bacterium]
MNIRQTSRSISDLPVGRQGAKVFVGLSGGVDSAVSAALLKQAGYDVTGIFIKTWSPDFITCTWREERRDAMRVAAHLDIPFLFFDFEEEYKKGVAEYMIEEYRKGRTPNPDVMCNRVVKFGAFWKKAKEMGADFIATGHYAQTDGASLKEGMDKEKDQSYFLWMLTQDDLSHTLFPVGHLEKKEVRRLAKQFGLPVSEKKDSQGICFLGDVDIEEFLSHFIDLRKGSVLDTGGEVIGTHNGALLYTLGERHGFEITRKTSDSKPYFVIGKNLERNTITVSDKPAEIALHSPRSMPIKDMNRIHDPLAEAEARIRYRQEKFAVEIHENEVIFEAPQTAAPGQSIVFYKGVECLGGAIMA